MTEDFSRANIIAVKPESSVKWFYNRFLPKGFSEFIKSLKGGRKRKSFSFIHSQSKISDWGRFINNFERVNQTKEFLFF